MIQIQLKNQSYVLFLTVDMKVLSIIINNKFTI